jgi:hypothetical protein
MDALTIGHDVDGKNAVPVWLALIGNAVLADLSA